MCAAFEPGQTKLLYKDASKQRRAEAHPASRKTGASLRAGLRTGAGVTGVTGAMEGGVGLAMEGVVSVRSGSVPKVVDALRGPAIFQGPCLCENGERRRAKASQDTQTGHPAISSIYDSLNTSGSTQPALAH